jgi:WD40 repeat protein
MLFSDLTKIRNCSGSNKIMVWELPELALVHVFPTTSRVWALWGDRKILASAGADSLITLRSMETGAILSRLKRPGHVFALWGPPDGTLIVSVGACKTSDTNTTRQTLNNLLNVQGSIVLRHLKPQHVLFRCATNLHDAQTTCMWSNGTIVACGGLEFVTVVGFRSGKILADFAIKTIVTGVWCFELDLGWVVVIAFRKNMLAIKIETGETIKEWEFPSHVHIHGDNTHNRLIAVGTWGLAIYNLSDQ